MRALHTPLAMAVLGLLHERPRHPYEMQALLRSRHVGSVVKLPGGLLYDAVRRLTRAGLVEPVGTSRAGTRPERTVYALTAAAGAVELDAMVRRYVGTVIREYPVFAAGLAHLLLLEPPQAARLLRRRLDEIETAFRETASALARVHLGEVPRAALLEVEYTQTLRRAEADWLRRVAREIEAGELSWPALSTET